MVSLSHHIPIPSYLFVKLQNQNLEKFIRYFGSQDIQSYLIIFWLTKAYSEVEKKLKKNYKAIELFQRSMESDLINNVIKQEEIERLTQTMPEEEFQKCKNSLFIHIYIDLMQKFLEKEYRFHYIQTVIRFIHNLIKLSLKLKNFPITQRKDELTRYLKKANKYIQSMKTKFAEVQQFQGILIPFATNKNQKFNSNLIVRIIENDFTCYPTRKRVPYRIIVETIEQIIHSNIQFIHKSQKDLNVFQISSIDFSTGSTQSLSNIDSETDFVDMKENAEELEKMLTEIAQSKLLFDYDINALKKQISLIIEGNRLAKIGQKSFQGDKQQIEISYPLTRRISMPQDIKRVDSIFERYRQKREANHEKFNLLFPKKIIQRRNSENDKSENIKNIFEYQSEIMSPTKTKKQDKHKQENNLKRKASFSLKNLWETHNFLTDLELEFPSKQPQITKIKKVFSQPDQENGFSFLRINDDDQEDDDEPAIFGPWEVIQLIF